MKYQHAGRQLGKGICRVEYMQLFMPSSVVHIESPGCWIPNLETTWIGLDMRKAQGPAFQNSFLKQGSLAICFCCVLAFMMVLLAGYHQKNRAHFWYWFKYFTGLCLVLKCKIVLISMQATLRLQFFKWVLP